MLPVAPLSSPAADATPSILVESWAKLLDRFAFAHFTTHTFKGDVSSSSAQRAFGTYLSAVENVARQPVAHAAVYSRSPSGRMHVHALLAGTTRLPVSVFGECWGVSRGFTHAAVYDRGLGARHYLGVHIVEAGHAIDG